MSRLALTGPDPADPELRRIFDAVRANGVEPPNLYQTLGNAPKMLKAWIDMAWPLRLDAKTPRRIRELMIMRGAQITGAAYEWAHHWPMALACGVTEEELRSLSRWRTGPHFDERERAALAFADEVMSHGDASDAAFDALRRHFTSEEIVELTLTATFYVNVARVLRVLRIEVEPGYRRYLETFEPD